ncbi:single-stranded DNA-binding protein [Thermoflexibacter ruber]|uniref:Single-stranded DNA-binding protein n=1 Tax=Thermoflexibacter ruber TaxID=1003 RepID=A0A1I2APS7_9BACT|nr:single-stranded DNA-binding protein [Thermoflexibacter ruber]SFE44880.1 single-strand binding protein [Thermoflexibacter ruber]
MRGLNKVMLIGNLGKEPEVQMLEGGITVAKFSLATTESYRDKEGNVQSETEWHNIVAWRSLADLAGKYLKKGSTIYLEGKIKTRSYEDKESNKKYVTEIIAESFIMLDKPADKAEINASF